MHADPNKPKLISWRDMYWEMNLKVYMYKEGRYLNNEMYSFKTLLG